MLVGFQHVIIAFHVSVLPKSLKNFKGCFEVNIQQYFKKGAPWIKTTRTRTFYKKNSTLLDIFPQQQFANCKQLEAALGFNQQLLSAFS